MSLEQFRLDGQVALISGGSRNLGKAMALALAGAGADIVICSRHLDEGEQARAEIEAQTGRRCLAFQADVTVREQIEAMVRGTMEAFGRLDILINNAGVGSRTPTLELSDEEWFRVINTNLTGTFFCTRAVVPHMISRKYGRIINISSALGSIALPHRAPYCASKGGIIQLTKVWALEFAEHGITVNCIAPGPFETPYNQVLKQNPQLYQWYLEKIPQRRWAECDEIGGAALFLASPAASFITGATLYVDGGWTAH